MNAVSINKLKRRMASPFNIFFLNKLASVVADAF